MHTLPEIDLQRRAKLESAWEIFADLIFPGMNYREELASLRRGQKDETLKKSEERHKRLERRTSGLRHQFLSFIPDGFFHVFGLNPDTDINSPELKPLNCKLFSPQNDGFEVNWDANRIKVEGRTFIALEFQPNTCVIANYWPDHELLRGLENRGASEPDSSGRSDPSFNDEVSRSRDQGGRPRTKDDVKALVRLLRAQPDFVALVGGRTAQAGEIRARLNGESARDKHDYPGFSDTALRRWIGEVFREPGDTSSA